MPESVVVGSDPVNGPRYYYVYNGHGDVVALTDSSGTVVASYAYDVWGNLTNSSESIPNANGWTNPYRYDGRDGARYDAETGLYWLSTRAYDPTLGRFLQRDPLGRLPLFFWNQPYVYAGNNPLVNVDPTGERFTDALIGPETAQQQIQQARRTQQVARVMPRQPAPPKRGSGGGGKKQASSCNLGPLCGIKNGPLFVEGILEAVAGLGILAAAVVALFNLVTDAGPFAQFVLKAGARAVQLAGGAVLSLIRDGISKIVSAFAGINPWVKFALDLLQDVADVVTLAITGLSTVDAILARGPGTLKFMGKLGLIIEKVSAGQTGGVFGKALDAIAAGTANSLWGGFQLLDDMNTTLLDFEAATHGS